MFLDIVVACLLLMAIYKGYSKGMVATLFSFVAIVIGLVIAFKFSATVATWLEKSTNIPTFWLPFFAFIVIIIVIVFVVKISSTIVEKIFQVALLGWLNKLCGIIIYVSLYAIVISGFLFFLEEMSIVKPETLFNSKSYNIIQPIAPKVIAGFGSVLPFIKETIHQLEAFFKTSQAI